MRILIAVLTGSFASIIVYWVGAVVAMLALYGIPLGSAGGAPNITDVSVHIVLASIAAFCGSLLAMRISRAARESAAAALGVLLAVGAALGFGQASSQWPAWFGGAMALSCFFGALAAAKYGKQEKSTA